MNTYGHTPRRSVGLLAAAAAATMTATVVSAPPAEATCASFWGLSAGSGCSSTLFSVAIAIGSGATATATSVFGTALALGTSAQASTARPFSFGITAGDNSTAAANDLFGIAVNLGAKGLAQTAGIPSLGNLGFNIALNVPAPGSEVVAVTAGGIGNIATNLLGSSSSSWPPGTQVLAVGVLNTATNLGGRDTTLISGSLGNDPAFLNSAIKVGGNGNSVIAGPGPLALAASLFQNGATVTKTGPGININGFTIGGAAATRHRTPSSVAAKRAASATPKPSSAARARR